MSKKRDYPFTILAICIFLTLISIQELFPTITSDDYKRGRIDDNPNDNGNDNKEKMLTPLVLLKMGYHSQIYDLIVENQVALSEIDPETNKSLLHFLARSYNLPAMRFLLESPECPLDVNAMDKDGNRPIHLAVSHPNLVLSLFISHLLIEYGADTSLRNSDNLSAKDLAVNRDERLTLIIDGSYDPRMEFESETRTVLDFAFGNQGPPSDPHIFE